MAAGCEGIDWPAWVQAVGSVVALFLAGGLAWWEVHRSRLDGRRNQADALRAKAAVLDVAVSDAAFFQGELAAGSTRFPATPDLVAEAIRTAIVLTEKIDVTVMPNKRCVDLYFTFFVSMKTMKEYLTKYDEGTLDARFWVEQFPKSLQTAREAVDGLNAEADRIECGGR